MERFVVQDIYNGHIWFDYTDEGMGVLDVRYEEDYFTYYETTIITRLIKRESNVNGK